MSSASASGANVKNGASAHSREHKQGNQDRKYTIEQKAAVIRVRKCATTAYYEILSVEKTATDSEIKKAYRKLSLLTHPDKNGYEGADEAFKMVSRAFQILSDSDKKSKYDKFGGDPDNRFSGASASSPFGGFGGFSQGRGNMYEDEISPEELFNRFFGGGGFGPFGGGMFEAGPSFVFNMGGGPGVRVHQFGGARPRRRPREANQQSDATPANGLSSLSQFLPLLLLFLFPLLSSLFSGSTSPGPSFRFNTPAPPHTLHRKTPKLKLNYYLNPIEVEDYSPRKLRQLDQKVEIDYVSNLRYECESEVRARDRMIQDAQGWFFPDVEKMKEARKLELRSCKKLESLNI
ncbi:Chaperone protein dnaJ [Ophidiomyces ophidiicola]|nr:Chaperone protein dnaJ [Ophidiomyces ophidiicola]